MAAKKLQETAIIYNAKIFHGKEAEYAGRTIGLI